MADDIESVEITIRTTAGRVYRRYELPRVIEMGVTTDFDYYEGPAALHRGELRSMHYRFDIIAAPGVDGQIEPPRELEA